MSIQNLINMSFEIFSAYSDLISGQNLAVSPFSIISIINVLSQNLDESSKEAGKAFFKKHLLSTDMKDQPYDLCEEQSKENIIKCNSKNLKEIDEKSDSLSLEDNLYKKFFSIIKYAQERVAEHYTESQFITAIYFNKNKIVSNSEELILRREKFIRETLLFNFKFFPLDFKDQINSENEILESVKTFSGLTVIDCHYKNLDDFDFILLNTPSFCGEWEIPFKQKPKLEAFCGSTTTFDVCMMEAFGEYFTYQDDDFIAVQLKYAACDHSFTILMPKDGKSLEDIKKKFLSNIDYNEFYKNFKTENLMINLPAFKILTDICLPDLLKKLKCKDILINKYLLEMFLVKCDKIVQARQIFSLKVNPIGTNFENNQDIINYENMPSNFSFKTIIFNKPFLFVINGKIRISSSVFTEFPFFIGQCNNPSTF